MATLRRYDHYTAVHSYSCVRPTRISKFIGIDDLVLCFGFCSGPIGSIAKLAIRIYFLLIMSPDHNVAMAHTSNVSYTLHR